MTTKETSRRFMPTGEVLALHPQAFGSTFELPRAEAQQPQQNVALIPVCGPLVPKAGYWFESYEGIREKVRAAIAMNVKAIVLSIDSPGGYVTGCFDAARDIRALCEKAGVGLYAHVDGVCASAAYAIASAAKTINVSQTATIGSIGVMDTMVDLTAQNALMGVSIKLVVSGKRKADGNPNEPRTPEAEAEYQTRVDALAGYFFDLCESHGWSTAKALKELEAAIMTGEQATQYGLASAIASLEETIAQASQHDNNDTTGKGSSNMTTALEKAMEELKKAAASDDEKEAAAAKKALAAMEEDGEGNEGGDDEEKKKKEEEARAAAEEEKKKEEARSASKGSKAQRSAEEIAIEALAKVHALEAKAAKDASEAARVAEIDALLAKRPDIAPELCALLRKQPVAAASEMINALPIGKPVRKMGDAANAVTTIGTPGAGQNSPSRLDPSAKAMLDSQMGLTTSTTEVRHESHRTVFGAPKS